MLYGSIDTEFLWEFYRLCCCISCSTTCGGSGTSNTTTSNGVTKRDYSSGISSGTSGSGDKSATGGGGSTSAILTACRGITDCLYGLWMNVCMQPSNGFFPAVVQAYAVGLFLANLAVIVFQVR